VLLLSIVTLVLSVTAGPLAMGLAALAAGFIARCSPGEAEPLGQLATRVIAPCSGLRAGGRAPNRFAQAIGAVVTLTAVASGCRSPTGVTQALLGS